MTNRICSMETLVNNSVQVYLGMVAVWPQFSKEETLNVSEIVPKFPGRFATNNSTVAFVHNNSLYATPYTRQVMKVLRENGYMESYFYVPFSNWDYPKDEQQKWEQLQKMAEKDHHFDFINDCITYCDQHNIGEISDELLQNCFEIPSKGVEVKHLYFQTKYYPIINGDLLDSVAIERIGKYCTNNGRVVFVYRDGRTFVAKGYKILSELRNAGYKESGLFVPFSNGEVILDPALRVRWESIEK